MWDKKQRETAPPPKGPPPRPVVEPPKPAPISVLSVPTEQPRGMAIIGKGMVIKGEIHSNEDLYLDGQIDGVVEVANHKLTVGPNGCAKSTVKAREVVVMGKIHGNIDAGQKIAIRKDGEVIGDIKTAGIVIDDEAYFKGSIDIVRLDRAAAAS
jgi:cytoskeletal protein CcmA (bactofilin family)